MQYQLMLAVKGILKCRHTTTGEIAERLQVHRHTVVELEGDRFAVSRHQDQAATGQLKTILSRAAWLARVDPIASLLTLAQLSPRKKRLTGH